MNPDVTFLVFAAGLGKRLGLPGSKVLAKLGGLPAIHHSLRAISACEPHSIIVVVGHDAINVTSAASQALSGRHSRWTTLAQTPLLGTGHALRLAASSNLLVAPHVVCVNGDDSALLTSESLNHLISAHRDSGDVASIVTTRVADEFEFGRVLANPPSSLLFLGYQEAKTRGRVQLPVATGMFIFKTSWLNDNIDGLSPDARGELPIYQLVCRARDQSAPWGVLELAPDEWCSSNTPTEFEQMRARFEERNQNE